METEAREAQAKLDRLFRGRSDAYTALVGRFGRFMPERAAGRFAWEHGTTLSELDTELYWAGWTADGVGTTVHVGSLLAALGY
jgi:hypothetical protein